MNNRVLCQDCKTELHLLERYDERYVANLRWKDAKTAVPGNLFYCPICKRVSFISISESFGSNSHSKVSIIIK